MTLGSQVYIIDPIRFLLGFLHRNIGSKTSSNYAAMISVFEKNQQGFFLQL